MVRRTLRKIIKVALTKELGKTQSYFIKLRWKTLMAINNLYGTIAKLIGLNETTKCRCSFKNLDPELKSFCDSGIRNLKLSLNLMLIIVLTIF
jgi:hypothetical protein